MRSAQGARAVERVGPEDALGREPASTPFGMLGSSLVQTSLTVVWIVLGVTVGYGVLGFVDDYRNSHPLEFDQLDALTPTIPLGAMVDRKQLQQAVTVLVHNALALAGSYGMGFSVDRWPNVAGVKMLEAGWQTPLRLLKLMLPGRYRLTRTPRSRARSRMRSPTHFDRL